MIILLLALIGTIIVMAILTIGRLGFGRSEPFDSRKFLRWFIRYFIFNFILSLFIIYVSEPALTGPFGGWQWVLWPLVLSSLLNLFAFIRPMMGTLEDISAMSQGRRSSLRGNSTRVPAGVSRGAIAAGIFGLVVAAAIGLVISGLIVVFTTWFDSNAKALAAIPNVTIEKSPTLPPTDPNHIVLVSQSVASYKGQQILGSNGQNLGSSYNIDPSTYTLQSIRQHLYYVAPLEYNNIFVNLSNSSTPGFVIVDAEDPQAVPQLCTNTSHSSLCPTNGASIAYLPGALLNQDLVRHVYLSGYTYGKLVDPTLELDDSFHPYWTISLMQPSRGYTGDVLSEVLIVDAHTGDIVKYLPKTVPAWVDRVMPSDTVSQYLQWWGLYHAAPWFNPSGAGQQTPAGDPQLLYNNIDHPVWLVPMTSSSSNDNSSTGVFLFDTHDNKASFYPLAGLGIGSNVSNTIQSTRANIRGYSVDSIQLYQIYNTPTWVAIFVQSSDSGDIFQAVGIVDARNLNGGNVQFETTLPAALQDYQQWLEQQANNSGGTPTSGTTKTVTGKVLRISSVLQGSNTIYYLQIAGQNLIFRANLSLSPKLPLVQPGDTVTGTYLNTGGTTVDFQTFDDLTINLNSTPSPSPGGTPSPTPAVTPTPTPTPKP
ncbi:MAG TPA: hypothetical protein VKX46_22070 [Ktedonobacteraceae bacterium]|nr:hypothetical protein [Ktedonobacteraceae bacterium]